ncbi:MAG: hypothetical protein ACRDRO_21535 [Pseudonocardiaceae bacterium]
MSQPQGGHYTVRCWGCMTVVYASDDTAPTDAQDRLTAFSVASCPKGGDAGGCPNTAAAVAASTDEQPGRLQQLVAAIRPRTCGMTLPALPAATPTEVPVVWNKPTNDDTYIVGLTLVAGPGAGSIRLWLKPGSLTTAGCTVLASCPAAVPAGAAGLHATAIP